MNAGPVTGGYTNNSVVGPGPLGGLGCWVSVIFKRVRALRGTKKNRKKKIGREGISVFVPLFHSLPMNLLPSICYALNQRSHQYPGPQRSQKYPGPQRSLGSERFPKILRALEISGPPEFTGPPKIPGLPHIPGTPAIPRSLAPRD
jgi:hypothetical protein